MRERDTPDPGGKPVDQHDPPEFVSAIVFEPSKSTSEQDVADAVAGVLQALRRDPVKRHRDRRFTVWFGTFDDRQRKRLRDRGVLGPRWAVGLPDRFLAEIHISFQRALRPLGSIIDIGRASLVDLAARPVARYDFGSIVLYDSPFAPAAPATNVEIRSAEVVKRARSGRSDRRQALPVVDGEGPGLHSLENWPEQQGRMVAMVGEMEGAASYAGLRRRLRASFTIEVQEVEDPGFARLGSLSTGWLDEDGCSVKILLRKHLAPELKYVALAHEVAHYALHFPFAYMGQLVEQVAWRFPAFEDAYQAILCRRAVTPSLLEFDANRFAAYLLLPPMYDLDAMAAIMFEGGRTPTGVELAWRFLQPLFPDSARKWSSISWSTLDEAIEAAGRDVAAARAAELAEGESLFQAMLGAVVLRESEEAKKRRASVDVALDAVYSDLFEELAALNERGEVAGVEGSGAASQVPELTPLRELVPPLDPPGDGRPTRVPLVPATKAGRRSRTWWAVEHVSLGPRPLDSWRAEFPRQTMALYPYGTRP